MSESRGQPDYVCCRILEPHTDKLNEEYSWKVIDDYCFRKYSENCFPVILLKFIGQQFLYTEIKKLKEMWFPQIRVIGNYWYVLDNRRKTS